MSHEGLDMEMVHVPGQMDFRLEEKEFPVTVFQRKISSVWDFVETPGHVAIITRKRKRECALMSIETYACISEDYEAEMAKVKALSREYREKRKAARRARKDGAENL